MDGICTTRGIIHSGPPIYFPPCSLPPPLTIPRERPPSSPIILDSSEESWRDTKVAN